MRREVNVLLSKSIDSILLSIEHFNRLWDRGRPEAVLILLDRSFELLLKASIIYKGGKIRTPRSKETIGFDTCVRKCLSEKKVKCLSKDDAVTIQIINSLRDAAQHYVLETSEQQLYTFTQAGVTLFNKVLKKVFNLSLSGHIPKRALPIATELPKDFKSLINTEFSEIKRLVKPSSRKHFDARTKLRSFAIIEDSLSGKRSQPSENTLKELTKRISKGESWEKIFPGLKRISISPSDDGVSINLKITKSKGEPVHLVPEGTPGATIVAVKRVDELGYYSLNLTELAKKVNLTRPKARAVIRYLELQKNSEYFKEIMIGKSRFKRYSVKALKKLKEEVPVLNIDEIWKKHRPRAKKRT